MEFEALSAEVATHLISITTHLSNRRPLQQNTCQTDILAAVQIALGLVRANLSGRAVILGRPDNGCCFGNCERKRQRQGIPAGRFYRG